MAFQQRVEQHHVMQFSDAYEHALQQKGGMLRPFVTEFSASGEIAAMTNIFGETKAKVITERRQANIDDPPQRTRRWLGQPAPYGDGSVIDRKEKWDSAFDPTSELMQAFAEGMGRAEDEVILEGIIGDTTTLEGKYGANSPKKFPTANEIAVTVGSSGGGTNVGMNPKKIRQVRKKISRAYGNQPMPEIYIGVTAEQVDDLLGYPEVTSVDFRNPPTGRPLDRGVVGRFLDLNFVQYEALPTKDAGGETHRVCPVWAKDGVKLGIWEDQDKEMKNDASLHASPAVIQFWFAMAAGRTQDAKVYKILCKEE